MRITSIQFVLVATGALLASAQENSAAPSQAPTYRSAFAGYKAWEADLAAPQWLAANKEMQELGGHVGQMKDEVPPSMKSDKPQPKAAEPATKAPETGMKAMDHGMKHGKGDKQ
ncbi:hypothetical protein [Chitinimonas naiadis]